jgi:hypothetical protein
MPVSLAALTAGAVRSVDATSWVNFFLMTPESPMFQEIVRAYTLCDCQGNLRASVLYCAATKT